jgi:hypothetical protein
MEETKVTFETAKLAKEKGFFDKNVYGEVRLSQTHYYDNSGILHNIREAFDSKDYDLKDCCNAPTQSLLQKWLREVHNIIVEPIFDETADDGFPWLLCIYKDKQEVITEEHPFFGDYFDNYEEVLEQGLQEALRLIEDGTRS